MGRREKEIWIPTNKSAIRFAYLALLFSVEGDPGKGVTSSSFASFIHLIITAIIPKRAVISVFAKHVR